MVKSLFRKSRYINFLILTLLAVLCGFIIYALVSVHFLNGKLFKTSLSKEESLVFIFIFGFLVTFVIKILFTHPMNITVDTGMQEITFTNFFFLFKKKYSFSDFDYYFITVEHSAGDHSKAIYLNKNNKRIEAIRGYYYSNLKEIEEALTGIPNHGFKKIGWLKVLRLYFSNNLN